MVASKPKISVIIPFCRAFATIDRCLESVFNQSEKDIEILLVVDAKDEEAVPTLKEKYGDRVTVLKGGNGVSSNRNIGLSFAHGEFISFVDSDDYLPSPNVLLTMLSKANDTGADIVIGEYKENEDAKPIPLPSSLKDDLEGEDSIKAHIEVGASFYFNAIWGSLYRKEIIGDTRFNESLIDSEDAIFFLEIALKEPKIHLMKGFCSYVYTKEEKKWSPQVSLAHLRDNIESKDIRQRMIEEMKPSLLNEYLSYKAGAMLYPLIKMARFKSKEGKVLYKKTREDFLRVRKAWRSSHSLSKSERYYDLLLRFNLLPIVAKLRYGAIKD